MRMKWTDKYSIGIEEIDKQHKVLIKILSDLENIIGDSQLIHKLDDILERLINYFQTHFSTEEEYLKKFEYHDIDAHMEHHKSFISGLISFIDKYKRQKNHNDIAKQLLEFAYEQLNDEITSDLKYVALFKENGLN